MTKNEIVARFMGYTFLTDATDLNGYYTKSYDNLMSAWVKFRDLKFEEYLGYDFRLHRDQYCKRIRIKMTDGTIQEAFDELVKGIEWHNGLEKN